MKAIVVPYAYPEECSWADEFFPRRSIAFLPVCGKPMIAYALDELTQQGVSEVLVLDNHYDRRLADFLHDGQTWGMKIIYTGCDEFKTQENTAQRHSAFIGQDQVTFVLGNTIAGKKISSLESFFYLNMSLIKDPRGCILPGYSAEPSVFIGTNVKIQHNADVSAPVFLGDKVIVGRNAKVKFAVLGDGCAIGRGAKILRSIIFPNTYIGKHIELIGKIVAGSRIVDPFTNAYVDLAGDGISEVVDAPEGVYLSFPAPLSELRTYKYTGIGDAKTDDLLATTLADLARDIASLDLPHLAGVYLGGGYGRGEGGAPLYNDLDFFPLVYDLQNEEEREEIQVALNALGISYGLKLGISVDFCRPKTRGDFKKDERRLMIQEFIRGNKPIFGDSKSLDFLKEYPSEELPASEILRMLVNRGMGLYLARDSQDQNFVNRNINKAVLGSGDAILMAQRRYRWKCDDRVKELGNDLYTRAAAFKFHPTGKNDIPWKDALGYWLEAAETAMNLRGKEIGGRTLRNALRYIYRRHRIGSFFHLGQDPLLRVFVALKNALVNNTSLPHKFISDWETFN